MPLDYEKLYSAPELATCNILTVLEMTLTGFACFQIAKDSISQCSDQIIMFGLINIDISTIKALSDAGSCNNARLLLLLFLLLYWLVIQYIVILIDVIACAR